MNRLAMWTCGVVLLTASPAIADDSSQGPDMSKMGPWARQPTNAKKTEADVRAFFDMQDKLWEKRDFAAALKAIDFPVYMFTDDAKTGKPMGEAWSQARYVAQMKSFWQNAPSGTSSTHKFDITVLSDSLVTYVDHFTLQMGEAKMSGKSSGLLVKVDGQWKWKIMGEAGWGGLPEPAPAKTAKK